MTPQILLTHFDNGQIWSDPMAEATAALDVAAAYQAQLAVRKLRATRGELPRGFKIGFTNRTIWPRYNVFGPIWGTVWDSTLAFSDGQGTVTLAPSCQPRIEPEVVFGMRAAPAPNAALDDLYDAIAWVAPGFEIVQSHQPGWKFTAPQTVVDGALHARLLVGRRIPLRELAPNAAALHALLAGAQVELFRGAEKVESGSGANVLDSPLHALRHFLAELRTCPGAPDLLPDDVVTTGTWTDAWPVAPGEQWRAAFTAPLGELRVAFI